MKIIHIDFTGPYTKGRTYQDNLLPQAQVSKECQVELWVTCYAWEGGRIQETAIEEFEDNGVFVRRFPFQKLGNKFITRKMRLVNGIEGELEKASPDIIMMHDFQTATGNSICKYLKKHRDVKMVVDSHAEIHNSGRNFLSRYILHRVIYRKFARKIGETAKIIFYLSPDVKDFLIQEYKLKEDKMEYLPLGGFMPDDEEYEKRRKITREKYHISSDTILIMHSGKLSMGKKTELLLNAFTAIDSNDMELMIAGVCEEEVRRIIDEAVQRDSRIHFLGWLSGDKLYDLMCAADIYAQPGTCSAALQNSICCRCAVLAAPYRVYTDKMIINNNGFIVRNEKEISKGIYKLLNNKGLLEEFKNNSVYIGKTLLDYSVQGRRIINC